MWRFLNNIPRAFRQYIHSPRPSAGVYNNVDDEIGDQAQEESQVAVCPFTGRSTKRGKEENKCSRRRYFNFACASRSKSAKEDGCQDDWRANEGQQGEKKWWQSYQHNFWNFMQGSNKVLEALSVGTAAVWGTESDKQRRKLRLLCRVLCLVPGENGYVRLSIKEQKQNESEQQASVQPEVLPQPTIHLAIKDAAGAAHDAAVNEAATDTLDSVFEEFQSMCTEYTMQNESLLGLQAAERGDMQSAVQHLHSSCMLGNPSACFNLGLCYETGTGAPQDLKKAKMYYSRAASTGHSLSLYNLGLLYLSDTSIEGDKNPSDRDKGLQLLEKAAEAGLAEAQTYLGILNIEERNDAEKAVPYFQAAADQNDSEAQYFLAICYEQGWGVKKNECRAAQLYSQSASAGHVSALYNLAVFNENGLGGLPVNTVSAMELYTKAAHLGNEHAKLRLEEIKAASKAFQANVSTFQALCDLHDSGKVSGPPLSRPLSPSASSPTLHQDNWNLSHYLPVSDTKSVDLGRLFDPGGGHNMKDTFVQFSLGDEDEGVVHKSKWGDCLTEESVLFTNLHRSSTSPNLALQTT